MQILKNTKIADLTSLRIGGTAAFFAKCENETEIRDALHFARSKNIKIQILGGGSNTAFACDHFDGLILHIANKNIEKLENGQIAVAAGESLPLFVNFCIKNGIAGIEKLAGIPGQIGGAIRGNAGIKNCEIGNFVEKVECLNLKNSEKVIFSKKNCAFSYRHSIFKQKNNLIITKIIFNLPDRGKPEKLRQTANEEVLKRKKNEPTGFTSGSLHKNPKNEAAWQILDDAGLRGLKVGGLSVSEKHSNWLVNDGTATTADLHDILTKIDGKVKLEREVEIIF